MNQCDRSGVQECRLYGREDVDWIWVHWMRSVRAVSTSKLFPFHLLARKEEEVYDEREIGPVAE